MKKTFFLTRWVSNLSISKKIYLIIGIFLVSITGIIFLGKLGMDNLSAIRAVVGGEGLWAKGQKEAAYCLRKYAFTHDEKDYQRYLEFLKIPLGDNKYRLELMKPDIDMNLAYQGYIEGRNVPEDFKGMTTLLRRFRNSKYIREAMSVWTEGEELYLSELERLGPELHNLVSSSPIFRRLYLGKSS